MRLEKRRVIPARQILDQSLKKTVRQLCRNEPVSNDGGTFLYVNL
jgi:hypothetical protein